MSRAATAIVARRATTGALRRGSALVLATLGVVTLSGCVGGAEDPSLPKVEVEALDVPQAMVRTTPMAEAGGGILPATGSLPFAIGGSLAPAGEAAAPTVWISSDGREWNDVVVDEDASGSFSGTIAGGEELSALGGTLWEDGALTSALWTSADREKWNRVELPDDFAASIRTDTLEVAGRRVLAIGTDYENKARGIVIEGDEVTEMKLPKPPKGELLYPGSLAVDGDTVILTASTGPEGEDSPSIAYRSTDGGVTWGARAAAIGDETAGLYGLVWTGETFVGTGFRRADSSEGAAYAAAAWSSPDGRDWTAEEVPAPSETDYYAGAGSDVWLGAAGTAGGIVTTIGGNQNQAYSGVYQRTADGAWSVIGYTTNNASNGVDGWASPAPDGSTVGLLASNGALRAGVLAGSSWSDTAVLSEREDVYAVREVTEHPDGSLLSISRSTFAVEPTGHWRNTSEYGTAMYDGDSAVEIVPSDPERLDGLLSVVRGSHDEAGEVALGSEFPAGARVIIAEGYFRPTPDAAWQPASGFPAEGATNLAAVRHTAAGWVAVGTSRADSSVSTPDHGVAWVSADGITWTASAGAFGSGALETGLEDVCELPNGTPIAVGNVEAKTGDYRPAAWILGEGSWTRADVGENDESRGWMSSCANDEDGVVVSATVAGRDVLLRTEDGEEWDTVFTAKDGVSLTTPVAVDGGFAAAGSWSNAERLDAVVWVSKDGREWDALSVPSLKAGATTTVSPSGDDLLVSMPATVGDPVLVVRDIADVIKRRAA